MLASPDVSTPYAEVACQCLGILGTGSGSESGGHSDLRAPQLVLDDDDEEETGTQLDIGEPKKPSSSSNPVEDQMMVVDDVAAGARSGLGQEEGDTADDEDSMQV